MPTRQVAAEFDQIATVYDETRDPLELATIDGVAARFRDARAASILEVGVGTGRVARPLAERKFLVTGIDASRGMLAKARAKGLSRLVRGSGYRLPFEDGAFDATLFVHVLHLLDDPERAIREASRVSRFGAFALVHPRTNAPAEDDRRADGPQHLVRQILREAGYDLPPRSSPRVKERDLLDRLPPDSLTVLSERDVTESVGARIERLAKRGHRQLLNVPPDALRRAVATARERVGDRTVTYHRIEALATWGAGRWDGAPGPGGR